MPMAALDDPRVRKDFMIISLPFAGSTGDLLAPVQYQRARRKLRSVLKRQSTS